MYSILQIDPFNIYANKRYWQCSYPVQLKYQLTTHLNSNYKVFDSSAKANRILPRDLDITNQNFFQWKILRNSSLDCDSHKRTPSIAGDISKFRCSMVSVFSVDDGAPHQHSVYFMRNCVFLNMFIESQVRIISWKG